MYEMAVHLYFSTSQIRFIIELSSASKSINSLSRFLALKHTRTSSYHPFIYLSINLQSRNRERAALAEGNNCNGRPIVGRRVITHPFLLPIRDDLKLPPKTFSNFKNEDECSSIGRPRTVWKNGKKLKEEKRKKNRRIQLSRGISQSTSYPALAALCWDSPDKSREKFASHHKWWKICASLTIPQYVVLIEFNALGISHPLTGHTKVKAIIGRCECLK